MAGKRRGSLPNGGRHKIVVGFELTQGCTISG